MNTHTQTITISARPKAVFALVADLERLPVWAIGFAKETRRENGGWLVRTGSGAELPIRVEADRERGTVDFFVTVAPGVDAPAFTRVMANGDGAEYVFTMFQLPEMPPEAFAQQAEELARELVVLKAHAESSCPL